MNINASTKEQALVFLKESHWRSVGASISLIHCAELPMQAIVVDESMRVDPKWVHFAVFGGYTGVGGCPYISVDIETGEIANHGVIGALAA